MTTTPPTLTPENELAIAIAVFLEVAWNDDFTNEQLRDCVRSTYANISEAAMELIEDPLVLRAVDRAVELHKAKQELLDALADEQSYDDDDDCCACCEEEYAAWGTYDNEPVDYVPVVPFRPITSASDLLQRLGL